jgi:hypothetical protein
MGKIDSVTARDSGGGLREGGVPGRPCRLTLVGPVRDSERSLDLGTLKMNNRHSPCIITVAH